MFYKEMFYKECIFRASGGTRFKNFCHLWWQKRGGGIPRCNQPAQKNSGYVTLSHETDILNMIFWTKTIKKLRNYLSEMKVESKIESKIGSNYSPKKESSLQ